MEKFLGVLVMMSFVLIGLTSFVLAADPSIGGTATVTVEGSSVTVDISPSLITFGSVLPPVTDKAATSPPVIISATGDSNNVNINVGVSVSAGLFKSNLKFNTVVADGMAIPLNCVEVSGVCTYTSVQLDPTLTVPLGTPAGTQSGTITYTITGQPVFT